MGRIVGIDLGTTNSLVAVVEGGVPYVVADKDGRRLTPSVVAYDRSGKVVVGEHARRQRVANPSRTFSSVKRFMGRRQRELQRGEDVTPFGMGTDAEGWVTLGLDELRSPESISAEVLRKLKGDVETSLEEKVDRAVITVPAYFNDAQRQATKRAGELAGFTVERILNEPTAAALAYGVNRLKECSKIAVFDLGGGTFDISILELTEGVFRVLSTHGNTRLGGDDIDKALADYLKTVARSKTGIRTTFDPSVEARFLELAEQSKVKLSEQEEIEILLPFLEGEVSFSTLLNRRDLEKLAEPIIRSTRESCVRALADAKLESAALDQVLMVGGQTRMPLVRRLVSEWFSCSDFDEVRGSVRLGSEYHRTSGPLLNTSQNPDEAVALGAAIQGAVLNGETRDLLLLDVTPLSLGLETFGGLMNVIIPRNSTIPTKAGEMFTNAVDGQTSMLVHILQGERERAKDNWSLGRVLVDFDPAPRGTARVGVQFEIDANGILHVLVRDTKSGVEKKLDIKSAVDVQDSAVQQMVEESVEHAFEDLAARRWVEAKTKVIETLKATQRSLAGFGSLVTDQERSEIESSMASIELILSQEDPVQIVGDTKALKSAHQRLDDVSKPFADRIMDQLSLTLLKRRGLI